MSKRAIIIGAGPAGLTAALELLRRTDICPVVLESTGEIGGLSRTVRYKGNRMDIGGHRFFSKSDRVMRWWTELMRVEDPEALAEAGEAPGQGRSGPVRVSHEDTDKVLLVRPRKSRIYTLRRFFDYPITLTRATLRNLGPMRVCKIGASYTHSRLRKIDPEVTLEDFLINRFGRELYRMFFQSYTEKVWGMPCNQIAAEWGAQRIRGLNLAAAVRHFAKQRLLAYRSGQSKTACDRVAQKETDTSLIERFLYPRLGPGQFWEHVADEVVRLGGVLQMGCRVVRVECRQERVCAVTVERADGTRERIEGDYFLSSMPMRDLIEAMDAAMPATVKQVSEGLQYRDFITVGLLVDRLEIREPDGGLLKDTWIYVQEPDVLLGRLQIFNNWSPGLVSDPSKVWIGLEYFCSETDPLWRMDDAALQRLAIGEVERIGLVAAAAVCDAHVVRVPKTYPAYSGTYSRFGELRAWIDQFENLFPVGRNGMHKYNNQDHSMLTAMLVVDGLCAGHVDKAALWNVNAEQAYHEAGANVRSR